jgi:tRNA threonylcarbamoyl adenosine modification protein YeaZ
MVVLAIETSGKVCGAGVSVDGVLIASTEIIRDASHDAHIADVVTSALRFADRTIQDVNVIAVSAGPGSFTGLRIGASFVKGLAFEGSPQILPVPTLTSLHCAAREVAILAGAASITSVIPSHRDLWYVQQYPCSTPVHEQQVRVCSSDEVRAMITPETFVVGPGSEQFTPTAVSGLTRLSARFIAFASWELLRANVPFADADSFVPLYQQEFVPR